MKNYLTGDFENDNIIRLSVFILVMVILSYLSSFIKFGSNFEKTIRIQIEEINASCPITGSQGISVDSCRYDGEKKITYYMSGLFQDLNESIVEEMKYSLIDGIENYGADGDNFIEIIKDHDVVIEYVIKNKLRDDENFRIVVDKDQLNER